jgi:hypothetical protein
LNRKEATTLFTELVAKGYVQPNLVSIEHTEPDKFHIKIKGRLESNPIELFLKDKEFSHEENNRCLIIFET